MRTLSASLRLAIGCLTEEQGTGMSSATLQLRVMMLRAGESPGEESVGECGVSDLCHIEVHGSGLPLTSGMSTFHRCPCGRSMHCHLSCTEGLGS